MRRFTDGDRVVVNYQGTDAHELREAGLDTTFEGIVVQSKDTWIGGMYLVLSDNGDSPFALDGDPDPHWYVMDDELEPVAA